MAAVRSEAPPDTGTRTLARTTGLLYLGLAVTGALGFLTVRPRLFDADDPATTLANLVERESLARIGIALELGIVITQALAALWFYRLFRRTDAFAAGSIAAFGLVNAVAILASASFLASALDAALGEGVAPGGDAATVQLMYVLSGNVWGVAAVFFGLWLVPMGWCVLRTGSMPRPLGWVLIAGGVGYVLSAFADYLASDPGVVPNVLTIPASVGEFWMIGYLLIRGLGNQTTSTATPADLPSRIG